MQVTDLIEGALDRTRAAAGVEVLALLLAAPERDEIGVPTG